MNRDAEPDWLRAAREKGLVAGETAVSAPDLSAAPARRGPPPPPPPEGCSEKVFQDHANDLCRWGGWEFYHTLRSKGSQEGFVDLVACREGAQGVAAELKVGGNGPTPGQLRWLRLLGMMGFRAFVWYPRDWPAMVEAFR
jgi:hypothetical protein